MNTEIIKIKVKTIDQPKTQKALRRAADIILDGGLVVFPTETVYGLGGDATSSDAAKKIYEAKGRPSDNPLIIHVSTPEEAEKYAYTSPLYYKLAEYFMPGPLTVIMKAKPSIPLETRGGLDTVAIRCPSSVIAHTLISMVGRPVAAPSANLSGSPSPTIASHVIDDMMGRVDAIIDGGECSVGLESTIVKIESGNKLILLRPGVITEDDIASVTPVTLASAITEALAENEVAESPGMKYRHYAPKAPLELLDGDIEKAAEYIKGCGGRVGVICYTDDVERFRKLLPRTTLFALGARSDEEEQARQLFFILREADKKNYDKIYAPLPDKRGIGLALYNRMIRAAAHTVIKV